MIPSISDEEFYKAVDKNMKRVYEMNIPLIEKYRLYRIIDESIQRHEENKQRRRECEEYSREIKEGLVKIADNYKKIENLKDSIIKGLALIIKSDLKIQKIAKKLHLNN